MHGPEAPRGLTALQKFKDPFVIHPIPYRLLDSISEHTEQRQGDNRRSQMEKLVRDELEKWDTDMDNKQAEAVQAHLKQEESKIAIAQDNSFE